MKHVFTCILVFLALSSLAIPIINASELDYVSFLNYLDANRALGIVKSLSDDQYEGRQAGTHGADLASEYIADYFNALGLKPAGDRGTYRAEFTVPMWQLTQVPTLTMIDGNATQTLVYRKDFSVRPGSGPGDYLAEVVFAGYGISAPNLGYDDYGGISVSGKFVMAIVGAPPSKQFQDTNFGAWNSKAESAISHGAVGLLLVDSPANPTRNYVQLGRGTWTFYSKITIIYGTLDLANSLLKGSGNDLSSIQTTINNGPKPKSFATGKRLQVSVKTSFIENAKGYNVLGYIPGSDSQKAVVIGAHYDHVGKDIDGTIFRGANDDASGVGVMMEMARVFSVGAKPKPSILFAAWSGEEQCLCGSYAYVNRPYFALANTVADLTLDMVGAGGALSAQISDTYTALRSIMADSAKQLQISLDVEGFSGGSDHAPFQEKRVPNLMFIYEPLDEVYHTPADTVGHISAKDLADTAKLTSLITLKLTEAAITANASTTTPQPLFAQVPFGPFGLLGILAFVGVVSALIVVMRRRKVPSEMATLKQPKPEAQLVREPAPPPPPVPFVAPSISTGYGDLDRLLAGGLPEGYTILIVSTPCDERDLLLRKIIDSGLSSGRPTLYVSNDPGRTQDLVGRYWKDFYAFSPQADRIPSPPANLYKIAGVENLSDLNISLTKAMEIRVKGGKLIIIDILTDILLYHKALTTRKWVSDFLAKRKAEGYTTLAILNPLIAPREETQSVIDLFDGIIEIYERELRERSRRFLVVKKMYGRRYLQTETMLDIDKLF